ncbi:MAG TPA: ABC transporter ATP-binding protein [Bradyrhizobium sp.]|nr:ABC transporter ATP-binding protein [Bradyrhizobium sp.]
MHAMVDKPAAAYLEICELRRAFGAVDALETINLTVAQGEFLALLGPSGCGKTTLLRCIAGLLDPTAGDIRVDGRSIARIPAHRRGLGMVFQSYALFPHMSVIDNVRFGLKMHRVDKHQAEQRIADAMDLVQLKEFGQRFPTQLSGGQQQRVAIARALVTHPSVLLLDEPFGALDAKLRQSMQIELRRLQRRLKMTMIFVTHDQAEALSMADRIAVMRAGRIEQLDTPARIYDSPATAFVADFIGQMNRFGGRLIERSNGHALLAVPELQAPLRARDNPNLALGDKVLAMIRPERIRFRWEAERDAVLTGVADDTVFNGERLSVFVQTAVGSIAVALPNVGADIAKATAAIGQPTAITWDADDLLLFPA